MARGAEQHGFEKILKSLLIASSIPKNSPDTEIIHAKVKKFFNWITQYFTLIAICKNGHLKESLPNEISPLSLFDNICEFLYYNLITPSAKASQGRFYMKGSLRAIKNIIRTIKAVYGEGRELDQAFESLEFVQILIQKLCHLAYGNDLPNKVAMLIAFQLIFKEMPVSVLKQNYASFLDAIIHVLNLTNEQLISQVEAECRKTLTLLLTKLGLCDPQTKQRVEHEKDFYTQVCEKLIAQLYSQKAPCRLIAMQMVEKISLSFRAQPGDTGVATFLTVMQRAVSS